MIGPGDGERSGLVSRAEPERARDRAVAPPSEDAQKELAVRWGIGCLVGAVALVGVMLLSALIAFYLQPPAWVQVVLGVALALGAVVLAWLVATAWGRATSSSKNGPPRVP